MSYREEAKITLAELLRVPLEQENQKIDAFINAIVNLAVDEMQSQSFEPEENVQNRESTTHPKE